MIPTRPEPPEGFEWHQPDAMELRCTECNDIVRAEVVDIHAKGCHGSNHSASIERIN